MLLIFCWSSNGLTAGRKIHNVSYRRGKSVKLTVELPAGYSNQKKYPLIFALPPGPGNARMVTAGMNAWRGASQKGYIVISPEVFGPSLGKTAEELVAGIFTWMNKNLSYDKTNVTLSGVSNGGIGSFFVAVAHPKKFSNILLWPGGIQGKANNLKVLKGKPVWLIIGGKDKAWIQMGQATKKALDQVGAKTRLNILPGQGHVVKIPLKERLQWIESAQRTKK